MPNVRAALVFAALWIPSLAAVAASAAPVAAAPLTLGAADGRVTLSGVVSGWTLGERRLEIRGPSLPLTRGAINARGEFRIPLPSPAQVARLARAAGDLYDVVGCDDQPSDYLVDGREALLYWLPAISVVQARGNPKVHAGRGGLTAMSGDGRDHVLLVSASDAVSVSVDVSCTSFGSDRQVAYDLTLSPGWNAVLDRPGPATVARSAPRSVPVRWTYSPP